MKKWFLWFVLLICPVFAHADYNLDLCQQLLQSAADVGNGKIKTDNLSYKQILNCNANALNSDLSVRALNIMFSGIAKPTINALVAVAPFIDANNFEYTGFQDETFEYVTFLITKFNQIVFLFVFAAVGISFAYYIIKTLQDDGEFLGRGTNVFWALVRPIVVIILMLPLPELNGYSTIHFIIFLFVIVGVLLANLVWFILPAFNLILSFSDDKVTKKNEIDNRVTVSELVNSNIKIHLCDITKRKALILNSFNLADMTQENIEGSKFYQCVKSTPVSNSLSQSGSNSVLIPGDVQVTASCASNNVSESGYFLSCGSLTSVKSQTDTGDYAQVFANHQSEFRNIAYNVIGRYCLNNLYREDRENQQMYRVLCADFSESTFKFSDYLGKSVVAGYSDGAVPQASAIKDSLDSLKNTIYSEYVSNAKFNIFAEDKLKRVMGELMGGWFLSSSFIFRVANEYLIDVDKFNSEFKKLTVSIVDTVYNSANDNGDQVTSADNVNNQNSNNMNYGKNYVEFFNNLNSSIQYAQANKTAEKSEGGKSVLGSEYSLSGTGDFLMDTFFPGLNSIKAFNGYTAVNVKDQTCQQDFEACGIVPINPFVDIIKMGVDAGTVGLTYGSISKGIQLLANSISKHKNIQESGFGIIEKVGVVAGALGDFFMIYLVAGMTLVGLVQMIVFVYFLGGAISWLLTIIVGMFIANMWLAMHLVPNRGNGLAGHARKGYKIFLSVLLKPVSIVLGIFVAFLMSSIMIAFLNVLYGIALNNFTIFSVQGSIINFFYVGIMYIIYFILVIIIIFRAAKAIYKIPDALDRWFELSLEDSDKSAWSQVLVLFQQRVIPQLRSFLLFKGK